MSSPPEAGNDSTGGVQPKHYRQGRRIAARYEIAKKKNGRNRLGGHKNRGSEQKSKLERSKNKPQIRLKVRKIQRDTRVGVALGGSESRDQTSVGGGDMDRFMDLYGRRSTQADLHNDLIQSRFYGVIRMVRQPAPSILSGLLPNGAGYVPNSIWSRYYFVLHLLSSLWSSSLLPDQCRSQDALKKHDAVNYSAHECLFPLIFLSLPLDTAQ
ncbi:hypothetical protein BDV38DRAFT_64317 [Aspergillus pseudotamarii]|uniref:Uncharacterized protein n=1 Tax=Aspergillus pseudotamarii TaxID=132259 RepID=A0A5N6TAA7_ASPPS|nr:uncharacterized protein BDV38DRAFT_64317 [Aspergillus pseudotamarii]KAE8143253.1 hypothetical protein BDV38DRAFT_64317 [Aspergillus pseudotamarii]